MKCWQEIGTAAEEITKLMALVTLTGAASVEGETFYAALRINPGAGEVYDIVVFIGALPLPDGDKHMQSCGFFDSMGYFNPWQDIRYKTYSLP